MYAHDSGLAERGRTAVVVLAAIVTMLMGTPSGMLAGILLIVVYPIWVAWCQKRAQARVPRRQVPAAPGPS